MKGVSDNKVKLESRPGVPINCYYFIVGERQDVPKLEVVVMKVPDLEIGKRLFARYGSTSCCQPGYWSCRDRGSAFIEGPLDVGSPIFCLVRVMFVSVDVSTLILFHLQSLSSRLEVLVHHFLLM